MSNTQEGIETTHVIIHPLEIQELVRMVSKNTITATRILIQVLSVGKKFLKVVGCQFAGIGFLNWSRQCKLIMAEFRSPWTLQMMKMMLQLQMYVAAPYWERPLGLTWWCHVAAGHPCINSWLRTAHWLHPAVSIALQDESRLISKRMRHLLYEATTEDLNELLTLFCHEGAKIVKCEGEGIVIN